MDIELSDYEQGILTGVLVSAADEAGRDFRTGPWVAGVLAILSKVNRATHQAAWKVAPTGNEAFGTKVTFWSDHWGNRHAVITKSPKPASERDLMDATEWGVVIFGSGMTYVPAEQLTLGWHPEALGTHTPA